ncbi:MAG: PIN domain-containing protein [Candidatus Thorarchaeota archaeon]
MQSTAIVLDTNFLLSCLNFQVDILSELERIVPELHRLVVPYEVIEELEKLERAQKALAPRVSLANDFIKKHCEVIRLNRAGNRSTIRVDDVVLALTKKLQGTIATNDRELRKKARAIGISTVFLREQAYLESDRI